MSRTWVSVFLALLICAGCQSSNPRKDFNPEAISRCLPPEIKLDTVALAYSAVDHFTVEQELMQVGAHVDEDGKLVDDADKEIHFYIKTGENPRVEAAEVDRLSEEYTVISVMKRP